MSPVAARGPHLSACPPPSLDLERQVRAKRAQRRMSPRQIGNERKRPAPSVPNSSDLRSFMRHVSMRTDLVEMGKTSMPPYMTTLSPPRGDSPSSADERPSAPPCVAMTCGGGEQHQVAEATRPVVAELACAEAPKCAGKPPPAGGGDDLEQVAPPTSPALPDAGADEQPPSAGGSGKPQQEAGSSGKTSADAPPAAEDGGVGSRDSAEAPARGGGACFVDALFHDLGISRKGSGKGAGLSITMDSDEARGGGGSGDPQAQCLNGCCLNFPPRGKIGG